MALGDYAVGDRGEGVSDLQGYLRDVGFDVDVDGVYGPQTQAAVTAFQRARGIRVDGIAGPETLIELAEARSQGWVYAGAPPGASASPVARPVPTPATPAAQPGAAKGPDMTGLVILVGLALALWWWQGQGSRSSSIARRFADDDQDFDAEPGGDDDDEEEGED